MTHFTLICQMRTFKYCLVTGALKIYIHSCEAITFVTMFFIINCLSEKATYWKRRIWTMWLINFNLLIEKSQQQAPWHDPGSRQHFKWLKWWIYWKTNRNTWLNKLWCKLCKYIYGGQITSHLQRCGVKMQHHAEDSNASIWKGVVFEHTMVEWKWWGTTQ